MAVVINSESETSSHEEPPEGKSVAWLTVGIWAAVSALAGGLAAAWWYRKTLKTLRETGETTSNPNFGIPADHDWEED